MKLIQTRSLVSVIPVSDIGTAQAWYERWLGKPDEVPMAGMAEWKITVDSWLQLDGSEPAKAGQAAVVIGVDDVAATRTALLDAGIEAGEIVDYEVVQVVDLKDPDGNRVSLAQVMT